MITHISDKCTSCDWMPVYDCEKFKDGTFPLCCPNLEKSIKDKIRKEKMKHERT